MKYLAIDYGTKRIGIAFGVKDKAGFSAVPVKSIPYGKWKGLISQISNFQREYGAEKIIMGNPLNEKNENTKMSLEVIRFKSFLEKYVGVHVVLVNERFSTGDAVKHLEEKRVGIRDIDAISAALILRRYFENLSES